ncbi:cytochrome P450 [Streptomyces sp. NPDC006372]|uniref:cytochrome P450 n=1 Tax=Streptomyces sp. NPDC006372 TaxID=3155599 RepID=UPI0033AB4225
MTIEVDLFSQEFGAVPFPVLSQLREQAPVHYDPTTRLWLVTRDEDIRRVLLDPETFPSDNALSPVMPLRVPALRILNRAGFNTKPALFNNSGPSHAGLRAIMLKLFSMQRVRAALPMIEQITAEELDVVESVLAEKGQCDLATTAARQIPVRVLLEILGLAKVAPVDVMTVAGWAEAFIHLFWGRTGKDEQREYAERAAELYAWLSDLIELRDVPEDSLLGALLAYRGPDGEPATREEFLGVCSSAMVAGHITTTQMISSTLYRALEGRRHWQALGADPALSGPWAEEIIRRETSLTAWRRVTSRDTTVGGVELPAGAQLLVMLTSAGNDPEAYENPEEICPFRDGGRRHVGFGLGSQRCPGAELARAEGQVVLGQMVRRFPTMRLVSEERPPYLELISFRAPTSVLVTV